MPYYGEVNANIAAEAKKAADARKIAAAAAILKAADARKADEEAVKKAAALKKAAEEATTKKAAEEAALKKAAEELAAQKVVEEAAAQKAVEEAAAAQKIAKEAAAAQKVVEEAAAILKAAEELAARKAAEELAARKAAEEAAAQKAAEELAARKAAEEAAAKKAVEEAAVKKAAEEAAAKKADAAAVVKKVIVEEADNKNVATVADKGVNFEVLDMSTVNTEIQEKDAEYINVNVNISKEDAIQLLKCVLNIPDGTPIKNNNNNTYIEIKNNFTNKDANAIERQDLYNLKSSFNDDIFDSLKTTTIKFVYTSNTYTFLKNCNDNINVNTNDNNNDTDYYLDIVCELAQAIQYAVKAAIIERLTSLYNIIICFTTLNPQISLNNIIIYTNKKKTKKIKLNSLSIICSTSGDSWISNEEYGIDLRIMNFAFGNINEHEQQKNELLTKIEKLYQKLFLPLNIINKKERNIRVDAAMANSVKNVYNNDTLDDNKTRGIDTLMKYPLSLLTLSKVLNEVSALFTQHALQHALQLASDKIKSNILDPQKTNTLNKYFNITDKGETEKLNAAVQAINTLNQSQNVGSLKFLEVQFNNMYNMLNKREVDTPMNLQKQCEDLINALNGVTFEHMIHDDILEHPQILSAITEATFVIINANITTGNVQNQIQKFNAQQPKLSGFVQKPLSRGGFRKTKYKKYTKKINKSIRQISGKYTKIIGGFRNTYTKQYTKKKYKKAKNKKQLIHNKS